MRRLLSILAALAIAHASSLAAEVFCRFRDAQGVVHYGRVEGDTIHALDTAPWLGGRDTGATMPLARVQLLAPSEPRSILCLANSYTGKDPNPPRFIRWFAKSPGAAAADGEAVEIPPLVDQLKCEAEIVMVIGRRIKNASIAEARDAIFGYAVGNEIFGFAETFQRANGEDPSRSEAMLAAGLKLGDRFAPFGPFIHRGAAWPRAGRTLTITHAANGTKTEYHDDTAGILHSPEKIVSELSSVQTLEPGDVIFTGATRAFIVEVGDEIVITIDGLGSLRSRIVAPAPRPVAP